MGAPVDAAFEVDAVLAVRTSDRRRQAHPTQPADPPSTVPIVEALALRVEAAESRIEAAHADNKPSIAVVGRLRLRAPEPRHFPARRHLARTRGTLA